MLHLFICLGRKPIHKDMRRQILLKKIAIIMSPLLAIMVCHAQLKPQPLTVEQQRLLFTQAESALKENNLHSYHTISRKLQDYPLYPYLHYQALNKTASPQDIKSFLRTYPDTLLSQRIRKKQLLKLAKQESWGKFIQLYETTDNTEINCYYYHAKQMSENYASIQDDARRLWLQAKSQPDSCDLIFSALLKQDPERDQLIWKRFKLSLESYQYPLAKYVTTLLAPGDKTLAEQYLLVYRFPTQLKKILKRHSLLKNDPDFLTLGLIRLAKKYPDTAQEIWQPYRDITAFSAKQEHEILKALAKGYKRKKIQNTPQWLDTLAIKLQDPSYLGFKAEMALAQEQWQQVNDWIEQLPDEEKSSPRWQYWHARSAEKLAQPAKAQLLFEHAATSRNYYGFLAAVHSEQPFPMKHHPKIIEAEEKTWIQQQKGFRLVEELYQLKRFQEGNQEWWFFINRLNQSQRYVAINLAKEKGWDRLALASTMKLDYKDDLSLRFPFQYNDFIFQQAKNNQLKPALIFALIRQESLFRDNAVSRAGARGLMQVMPYTAKRIARQLDINYHNGEQLFDPQFNITLGAHYLGTLHRKQGHPILAIASYNAGPHRISRWLAARPGLPADIWVETIPFRETREYVKHVVTYALIYDYLLGNQPRLNHFMFHVGEKK